MKAFDERESKVKTELSRTILLDRLDLQLVKHNEPKFQDSKRKRDETVEIILRQETWILLD